MDTILIVEDHELSRDALTRRLETRGFRVVSAGDGEQALALAGSTAPDLILMDFGLPRLDGWSATRRLKSAAATQDIPIIVVSAHATWEEWDAVVAVGGDGLHPKPVEFEGLLATIQALLKRGDGRVPEPAIVGA